MVADQRDAVEQFATGCFAGPLAGLRVERVEDEVLVAHRFSFSASHELRLLPVGHKCRRNHGHNYTVTASVRVPEHLSRECLAPLGDYLVATFDHRLLNEQVSFHPTSELLAAHLAQWCRDHLQPAGVRLVAVEVSETPSTSARCDGVTGEVTIAKTYRVGAGAVTVTLGADGLDEVGFIIDFGALEPFAAHLHDVCDASGQVFSPVAVGSLAMWFVHEFEPSIRARLLSVRCENPTVSALWERSGHR